MTIETVLMILLGIVVLFAIAWLAKWIIDSFFPEPVRTPALLIVGVILLILVVMMFLRGFPGVLH